MLLDLFPKKPSGPKHVVCHHCGAFGHLRPHCSKFHTLKKIKRKEKLELHTLNALNSLSMCISGSHSFNPHLTSHGTLIPNNRSVWMRKGSYG